MDAAIPKKPSPPRRSLAPAASLILLALLASVGVWFYLSQERDQRQRVAEQLASVGELKLNQILQWRTERLADATVVAHYPTVVETLRQAARLGPRFEVSDHLRVLLRSVKEAYRYDDVLLAEPRGGVVYSVAGAAKTLNGEALGTMKSALGGGKPLLTDLHAGEVTGRPHVSAIAPVLGAGAGDAEPLGAVVLVSLAEDFLYPLIQSWPLPSRSAETLLVRRDGGDVLFLNELRHRSGSALQFRIPLDRTEVPGVLAALGREEVVRGRDYRGVEVLAVLNRVPDSPWSVVSKIDEKEAFTVWRFRSALILALLLALMAATGAAGLVVWQRSQKRHLLELYQSEAARRASLERYTVTLRAIGDAVIATDAAGIVELLNPEAEALTGWKEEEARGRPLGEVFHIVNEETGAEVENPVTRVLRDGAVAHLANHTLLIARDGTGRPIADSGAPIHDERGAIAGVVLVFRDQTEERRAQKKLKNERDNLRALMESSPVGILVLDEDARIVTVNPVVERLFGRPRGELRGTPCAEMFGCDSGGGGSACPLPGMAGEVIRGGAGIHNREMEGRIEAGGQAKSMVWRFGVEPVVIAGRRRAAVWLEDITALKRAAETLRESEERFRRLYEESPGPYQSLDLEGRLTEVNNAWLQELGYRREEVIGRWFGEFLAGDGAAEFGARFEEFKARGTMHGLELELARRDGDTITAAFEGRVSHDASGRIAQAHCIFTNITERKRAEQEREKLQARLVQAQKMEAVGRLAGGVAHDFNNLLTVINGYSTLGFQKLPPGDPVREYLREISQAGERAAALTRQLLAFSRKQVLQPQRLSLNRVAADLQPMLVRLVGEDIEVRLKLNAARDAVMADPHQIEQVIMNLVVNARDAMPDGGTLILETADATYGESGVAGNPEARAGQFVVLAVSDTGAGMDEATRAHIFEPFFTTKETGKGTGLGLAMVHGIVRQSGGWITVYSELGHGSTFRVHLPRAEEVVPEGESQPAERLADLAGTETILVVEDQEEVRSYAEAALREYGYRVLTAADADAALEICRGGEAVALLLTDVVMPKVSGRELAARLSQVRPEIKVLFMSGYSDSIVARHGILEEGVALLQKPFTPRQLAEKVRQVLRGG